MTATHIKAATNRNQELCQVVQFLQKGWPANCHSDEMKPYFSRRSELSLYDSCVLWGNSVLVPKLHREAVLVQLHDGHPGMAKMKAMPKCMCGGQEFRPRSNNESGNATLVNFNSQYQL